PYGGLRACQEYARRIGRQSPFGRPRPLAGRLDPESGALAASAGERARLHVYAPRTRQIALEVVQEAPEQLGHARTRDLPVDQGHDVRALAQPQRADAVVVQDVERARAAPAVRVYAAAAAVRTRRARQLLDAEPGVAAAAQERAGLSVDEPGRRQDAVVVAQELSQVARGLPAGDPADRQERDL